MSDIGVIYSLSCPKTNTIRYIGQTKQTNPVKRYYQHKYQWSRCENLSHVNAWIKSLFDEKLFPIFNIIESDIPIELLNPREKAYIKLVKACGAKLTNITEGGECDFEKFIQKEEWKLKRAESLKTSVKWKEKHKRHSGLMKDIHSLGIAKVGFKHLSEEKKRVMNIHRIEA
jgi:hypothetical protein